MLGKAQDRLEQISVYHDLEASAANLGIAFGNGQTEAVPFRGAGFVAANKASRNLLCVKAQRSGRNILPLLFVSHICNVLSDTIQNWLGIIKAKQ